MLRLVYLIIAYKNADRVVRLGTGSGRERHRAGATCAPAPLRSSLHVTASPASTGSRALRQRERRSDLSGRRCIPMSCFFSDVLMNSPIGDTVVDDDLRYIDWSLGGPYPEVLTAVD